VKAKSTETALVRACLELLKLRGVFAWRNNTTGVFDPSRMKFRKFTGLKGVSDILGILPGGRLLAVECKVGRNQPTEGQLAFIQKINGLGGLAVWVTDVGELAAWLSAETLERHLDGGTRDGR
jgi:hypothetical protein